MYHRCERKKIWLTNLKYLNLSTEHLMDISISYIYICVYNLKVKDL